VVNNVKQTHKNKQKIYIIFDFLIFDLDGTRWAR